MMKIDLNNLSSLTSLPSGLEDLYCGYNRLTQLPELPHSLSRLNCPHNRLTHLPRLPELTILDITENSIQHLHPPDTLVKLYCSFNPYLQISTLPNTLIELHCCNNHLRTLILPSQIEIVYCSYNELQSLILPLGLKELYCDHNQIKQLVLPETLHVLDCVDNQLTSLQLPSQLRELCASYNELTSITLPKSLVRVNLSGNPLAFAPTLHKGITFLNLNHTNIESCFNFYAPLGGIYFFGTPLYTKMKSVLQTETPTPILNPDMVRLAFEIIQMIEGRFRENYYGLKIKECMMAWMWRARETLAKRKYHPDELLKLLAQDDYVDRLEGW